MYVLTLRANDRYAAHQIVEARLNEVDADVRWGQYDDGTIELRSTEQIDPEWELKEVPCNGTTIRFTVDTQVRKKSGLRPDGRKRRIITLDYTRNLDWIERQAPETGLQLVAVDFDPVSIRINRSKRRQLRPNTQEERYPFLMMASRFYGTAKVTDATLFNRVLGSIPRGNPKAFGLGFILYKPTGNQ